MAADFSDIPDVVIDYVRRVFAGANDKVSAAIATHPAMHEEMLDSALVTELTAAPPAFFAREQIAVAIESHWLGGRRMFGRWEIADIAFFISLRHHGHLTTRKVALLQTKRLYSNEISTAELDESDYVIGIGRLVDQTDPTVPLSRQRAFSFDSSSVYGALRAGDEQIKRIDEYTSLHDIPVYYGLYNPCSLPFQTLYPPLDGKVDVGENKVGCRIIPAPNVHKSLSGFANGRAPSVSDIIKHVPKGISSGNPDYGWRLETFIADEVLRCRQGRRFDGTSDINLQTLLYRRTAPIMAAIAITVDFGGDAKG